MHIPWIRRCSLATVIVWFAGATSANAPIARPERISKSMASRRRIRLSPTIVCFSLLACAVGHLGCNSVADQQHSQDLHNQAPSTGETADWKPLTSREQNRMLLPEAEPDSEMPQYRTIWDTRPVPLLVTIKLIPVELFGQMWNVQVVGRDGQEQRIGQIRASQDSLPYCLVEVMSTSRALPEPYRNRWILCVGFTHPNVAYDRAKPIAFYIGHVPDQEDVNWIDVEPIRWFSDDSLFNHGVGVLNDRDAETTFRIAETSLGGTKTDK